MSEPYVYHFVMTRGRQPKAAGERLASACFPPELVAKLGLARVRATIEAQRRSWAAIIARNGYSPADGYAVNVISERGFRRSLFPVPVDLRLLRPSSALILPPDRKDGAA